MYLPSGTILNGRYGIEAVLGHGGFGITYVAHDQTLKVRVAVKEYLPRQLATRGEGQTKVSVFTGEARQQYDYGLRKFLEEAQSVARFAHHPNVVSARDYFEANGTAYMVMEYVEGVTLKEYLEKKGGRISFEEAKAIMMPVMDALREVHQAGMLHRDVSPDNIYITTAGQVKVLDFGAARYFAGEQSKSLSVILKPGYAPEEQYRSSGKQGAWTDVYAIGATLYRLISGITPPDALDRLHHDTLEPPSHLGIIIPRQAELALLKGLSVGAKNRFSTIEQFQGALLGADSVEVRETIAVEKPGLRYPGQPSDQMRKTARISKAGRPGRRFGLLPFLALIAAVCLLSGGLFWLWSSQPHQKAGEKLAGTTPLSPQVTIGATKRTEPPQTPSAMQTPTPSEAPKAPQKMVEKPLDPAQNARKKLQAMGLAFDQKAFADALNSGNLELIRLFLTAGMDPNFTYPSEDNEGNPAETTPLVHYAGWGKLNIVKTLIEHGAKINFPTKEGFSPLMAAANGGQPDVVRYLIERGADINLKNDKGLDAIKLAKAQNYLPIVKTLESARKGVIPDPNKKEYEIIDYSLEDGIDYFKKGQYQKALTQFRYATDVSPNKKLAYYYLGLTYNKLGNNKEAIKQFEEAIKLKPNFSEARYNLAKSYFAIGEKALAFEEQKSLATYDKKWADKLMKELEPRIISPAKPTKKKLPASPNVEFVQSPTPKQPVTREPVNPQPERKITPSKSPSDNNSTPLFKFKNKGNYQYRP